MSFPVLTLCPSLFSMAALDEEDDVLDVLHNGGLVKTVRPFPAHSAYPTPAADHGPLRKPAPPLPPHPPAVKFRLGNSDAFLSDDARIRTKSPADSRRGNEINCEGAGTAENAKSV